MKKRLLDLHANMLQLAISQLAYKSFMNILMICLGSLTKCVSLLIYLHVALTGFARLLV